jgi:hypothetical protein
MEWGKNGCREVVDQWGEIFWDSAWIEGSREDARDGGTFRPTTVNALMLVLDFRPRDCGIRNGIVLDRNWRRESLVRNLISRWNSLNVRELTVLLVIQSLLIPAVNPASPPVVAAKPARVTAPLARAAAQGPGVPAPTPEVSPSASTEAASGGTNELVGADISVGYADNSTPSVNFPAPWQGSPNVILFGGGSPINGGAIRIENTSSAPLVVDKVEVDLRRPGVTPGPVFNRWGRFTIPPQSSAILTQTAPGNFSTKDYPVLGCGAPLPSGDTPIPKITVTIGGAAQSFPGWSTSLPAALYRLPAAPESGWRVTPVSAPPGARRVRVVAS